MCEEYGLAVRMERRDADARKKPYVRSLINDFKYESPDKLKRGTGEEGLSCESHSFSRVFSGAVYECFRRIYESRILRLSKDYANPEVTRSPEHVVRAMEEARDAITPIFVKAVDRMAEDNGRFNDAALCNALCG